MTSFSVAAASTTLNQLLLSPLSTSPSLSMTPSFTSFNATTTIPSFLSSQFSTSDSYSDEVDDAGSEYLYILPSIIIFGVVGNIISFVAILHSRLRKTAANQYLILLTAADSVFLLALFLIWAKLDYVAYNFCVLIEYILQVASYVSSWSISVLTIERYLAIVHPLKHMRYSHVNRFKLMAFWVPIPFILNLVQFFALTEPHQTDPHYHEVRKCVSDNGNLQVLVEMADVLLCYVIPCLIVVILNLLVAAKVNSAEKSFMVKKEVTPETSTILPDRSRDSRRQGRPNSSSGGSTRILLVVPVVYIILNTPFYLIRLVDTIAINVFGNRDFAVQGGMNEAFIYIHNTAYYLYYINFACDVIVYAFSSANFRKTVVIAWKRIICPKLARSESKSEAQFSRSCRYTLAPSKKSLEPTKSLSPSVGEAV